MRKIDKTQDAVNHGIAKGNQGIDTAEGDTIYELLKKLVHLV